MTSTIAAASPPQLRPLHRVGAPALCVDGQTTQAGAQSRARPWATVGGQAHARASLIVAMTRTLTLQWQHRKMSDLPWGR
eukprot:6135965-Alexandrium_andersonii.AAC.1